MPPEIPATVAAPVRRPRWVSALLLAVAAILAYVLYELRAWRGQLGALASAACHGDAAAASRLRAMLHAVLALVPASTFAFAAYVGHVARRTRRDARFPPQGVWASVSRTVTGPPARHIGTVLLLFAGTLAALALVLLLLGLRILALLNR